GGEAVVVPAHGEEDPVPGHPPVPDDEVLVGVAEDVADVERSAHRRRRGVDGEGPLAGLSRVPAVEAPVRPSLPPLLLRRRLVVIALLGHGGGRIVDRCGSGNRSSQRTSSNSTSNTRVAPGGI